MHLVVSRGYRPRHEGRTPQRVIVEHCGNRIVTTLHKKCSPSDENESIRQAASAHCGLSSQYPPPQLFPSGGYRSPHLMGRGFPTAPFLSRALLPEAWRCGWLQAVRRPERSGLCDIHQTFAIAPVLQIELVCCRVRPTGIGSHAYRIETRRCVCFGCSAGVS